MTTALPDARPETWPRPIAQGGLESPDEKTDGDDDREPTVTDPDTPSALPGDIEPPGPDNPAAPAAD